MQATRLELGPGLPLEVLKRESFLRESVQIDLNAYKGSLQIITKIQRSFRKSLACKRKEQVEAEKPRI